MIHNNGRIPATASGYLGTTVVEDAWQRFQKDDPLNQWVGFPRQERQWRWLHVHRAFFEGAHFLAVDKKGFFVATPALQRLEDPWALYGDLLQTLLLRGGLFHHSNLADTLQKVLSHCGGTLLYVLAKESQKQAKSDGWLTAGQLAPVVTSSLPVDAHQAETLVDLLMARGPFESFGLIEPHTQERVDFTKPTRFRPTNLFWKVFELGT